MSYMNIIVWLVFGAIVGWIADLLTEGSHGLLEDIILGIIGAFVGGFIMNFFGASGVTGFNLYSFIVAIIGAVVLITIGRVVHK